MGKVKGFYTDEKKRVRPITERIGGEHREPSMKVHRVGQPLLLDQNVKGFTVHFKYKDGHVQEVPIVAKDWNEALEGACVHIDFDTDTFHNVKDVDEIRIVDPDLKEVLKKIGAGARKAVGVAYTKGKEFVKKVPSYTKKTAEVAGEIRAIPRELREAYAKGKGVPVEGPRWSRGEIMRLVDQAIKSSDTTVRVTARGYLRKYYPQVYSELLKVKA